MKKILVVEDNILLLENIKIALDNEYEVTTQTTAKKTINNIGNVNYDLYIIDILLPDKNGKTGLDICKELRICEVYDPILIITAKNAINFKLGAFKYGADDYLCKPFNILELKARVKALLKRTSIPQRKYKSDKFSIGTLTIDGKSREVFRNGSEIFLRRKEYDLLICLLNNRGIVMTRDALLNMLWSDKDNVTSNTVDVHIKNLRTRVETPNEEILIKTIYGVGYKIE